MATAAYIDYEKIGFLYLSDKHTRACLIYLVNIPLYFNVLFHNIMTNNTSIYDKWVLAKLNSNKEANSMLRPLASNAVINCEAFFIR